MTEVHAERDLSQGPEEITAEHIPGHPPDSKGTSNNHHSPENAPEIPETKNNFTHSPFSTARHSLHNCCIHCNPELRLLQFASVEPIRGHHEEDSRGNDRIPRVLERLRLRNIRLPCLQVQVQQSRDHSSQIRAQVRVCWDVDLLVNVIEPHSVLLRLWPDHDDSLELVPVRDHPRDDIRDDHGGHQQNLGGLWEPPHGQVQGYSDDEHLEIRGQVPAMLKALKLTELEWQLGTFL